MFGSTVEYVLKSFTEEYQPVNTVIGQDGAMHHYRKDFHPVDMESVKDFLSNAHDTQTITTPIYPFKDHDLPDILKVYQSVLDVPHRAILIHASSIRNCELNLLFQYHKIAFGSQYQYGLDFLFGNNQHNITKWNPGYRHWSDMQIWEQREWFSLFYPGTVSKWIRSQQQVDERFLTVTNTEILVNPVDTFEKIIKWCGLTAKPGLEQFCKQWELAQQYITNEYNLIDAIVEFTLENHPYSWGSLNIISEAIIQHRLREKGYEIQCDGLNTFPTDSESLAKLLKLL